MELMALMVIKDRRDRKELLGQRAPMALMALMALMVIKDRRDRRGIRDRKDM